MKKLCNKERWTSLAAFLLVLLFAGAADGLMEILGPAGFLAVGAPVLGAAWALTTAEQWAEQPLATTHQDQNTYKRRAHQCQ